MVLGITYFSVRARAVLYGSLALGLCTATSGESSGQSCQTHSALACGYEITTGTYSTWPGGYQSWVTLENVSGATATDFEVFLDVGNTTVQDGYQAEFALGERGYNVNAPSWLEWQTIPPRGNYSFGFIGQGKYEGVTPYVISVNGQKCDTVAPVVELSVDKALVTSADTLTLTAQVSDNVAVRKVVFEEDGVILGEDWSAPYTLTLPVDGSDNGRHVYTARAVDPSGNSGQDTARTLIAIGNRFFGGAGDAPDADFADYFDQVTPENAGKWGSVEPTRDEYNWGPLDETYAYAKEYGFPFKLHTLVWGSQQPGWLSELSPEEQLEEIEEWFSGLAERYPDVDFIDVVNEPLHAPPNAYIAALGGAGETGWDWVIKSFELARQYFPKSELILNEYQILILPEFVPPFLDLVTLLQERDLIDGIGEQGHFLERAELPVVKENLEALAATGLPLYISEFDVNFANDARQAIRFAELFSLFWENPSVLGITHWGYKQDQIWRTQAYLLRNDGTARPALDWLLCTLDGEDECSLPEYVPVPWVGGQYGLTLEAEEYDNAEGIAALGPTVAYTDDGDWLSFSRVTFAETWDKFWVNYSKGNEEVGTISIHVDDFDSPAVLEVELPSTGDWGITQRLEFDWPLSLSGEHDIYVKFNGVIGGVANVENLRFGTPAAPEQGPNLVANGTFEEDASGWGGWQGTRTTTTALVRSGSQSLLVEDQGVAQYALTDAVTPGENYHVGFWVTITGAESAPVKITGRVQCQDEETIWTTLDENVAVPEGEWVELVGTLEVPDCTLVFVSVFVEGAPAGVALYVDDVAVYPPVISNLVANGTFEEDASGWGGWQGTRTTTTALVRSGSQSLLVEDQGVAQYALTDAVTPGENYHVGFWVTITGAESAPVKITGRVQCQDEETIWTTLDENVAVPEGEWVELVGTLEVPDCTLAFVSVFAEGAPAGVALYVDDVVVH